MSDPIHDPIHRARYTFTPDGDNLWVDTWLEPGGFLPAHMHPRQEERWSVVEGQVRIQLGSAKRLIGPEDGAQIVAPYTKHALTNLSDREVHARCHVLPALNLQEFLTDSAAAAREGLFIRSGVPKGLRGARWGAAFLKRHREDVVMTFPPRFVQSALIATLGRSA
jgi:quercetin dioxygenase-like cupin family protein